MVLVKAQDYAFAFKAIQKVVNDLCLTQKFKPTREIGFICQKKVYLREISHFKRPQLKFLCTSLGV